MSVNLFYFVYAHTLYYRRVSNGTVRELILFAPGSYMFKLIIGIYLISNYNLDLYW